MALSLLRKLFPSKQTQMAEVVPEIKERVPTGSDSTLEKEVITGRVVKASSRNGYLIQNGSDKIPAFHTYLTIEGSRQHRHTYPYSNLKQFETSETSEGTFRVDFPTKYQHPTGLFGAVTSTPQKVVRSLIGKNVVYTQETLMQYIPGQYDFFSQKSTYRLRLNSGKLKGKTFSETESAYPL